MKRRRVTRTSSQAIAFLAAMMLCVSPVSAAMRSCCCESRTFDCHDDTTVSACCAAALETQHQATDQEVTCCCQMHGVDLEAANNQSTCTNQPLWTSCTCSGCDCDVVAAVARVANSESSLSYHLASSLCLDLTPLEFPMIWAIEFTSPVITGSSRSTCIRFCRWLN